MLILKDEHAIDVLNSGNIGHQWHDFHAIDVHATDVGDPMDARMKACEECHRALVETTEGNQNFWDQSIQCVGDDDNNDNNDYEHANIHCKVLICQDSIFDLLEFHI